MPKRPFPVKRTIATGLLLFVAVIGFLSLQRVRHRALDIVEDTLPGLADASVANSMTAKDFNFLLLALMTSNAPARAEFTTKAQASEVEAAKYLKMYEDSIFETEDRDNFNRLMESRRHFLETRSHVVALMNRNEDQQALAEYRSLLRPSYDQCMTFGKVLLDYNTRQGKARGKSIMRISNMTQYAVAAFAVALFMLGFGVGIFRYNPLLSRPKSQVAHKPVPLESRV